MEDIVIGATVHGGIIYSIGDTLCLTPIIEEISKRKNQLITVSTSIPELFYNNPYIKEIVNTNNLTIDISHSLPYYSVDAGLYHIAAALDIPQVVFFRNNQSANNSYPDTYNIESKIKCEGGCLARHLRLCQSNNRCMDNFDLDRYYNLITKVLPI